MSATTPKAYEFEGFRVDTLKRQLRSASGEVIDLPARAFDALLYLIEHHGEDVSKERLIQALWPNTVVEENNLNQAISAIRRALGDDRSAPRYVMTVPGRGYRFIAPIRDREDEHAAPSAPAVVTASTPPVVRPVWRLGLVVLAAVALGAFVVTGSKSFRSSDSEPSLTSLAVLPFTPLLEHENDPALELGMADTLITQISTLPGVAVTPFDSVRRYSTLDKDPLQAGAELGVAAVLEGSIHRSGRRIRVTSRLLQVSDGRSLWAGRFEEPMDDIFAVQDAISARVMEALAPTLSPSSGKPALHRPTENLAAFQHYASGLHNWNRRDADGYVQAVQNFEAALREDPAYVRAWSGLAAVLTIQGVFGLQPPQSVFPRAKQAALEAVELGDRSADALAALAHILVQYEHKYEEADEHYRRAVELNTRDANTRMWMAINRAHLGRTESAVAEMRRAQELEPGTIMFSANLGMMLYYARAYDDAIVQLQRVIGLQPDNDHAHRLMGRMLLQKGDVTGALKHFNGRTRPTPGSFGDLGRAYAAAGRLADARAEIEKLHELARDGFGVGYDLATIHASLNEMGPACAALRTALRDHSQMIGYLKVDPAIDKLRSEPCFAQVAAELYST